MKRSIIVILICILMLQMFIQVSGRFVYTSFAKKKASSAGEKGTVIFSGNVTGTQDVVEIQFEGDVEGTNRTIRLTPEKNYKEELSVTEGNYYISSINVGESTDSCTFDIESTFFVESEETTKISFNVTGPGEEQGISIGGNTNEKEPVPAEDNISEEEADEIEEEDEDSAISEPDEIKEEKDKVQSNLDGDQGNSDKAETEPASWWQKILIIFKRSVSGLILMVAGIILFFKYRSKN